MNKNLRWKVIAILAVLGLSVLAFYPPRERVRLGLDRKGGVHLVMRVQTEDALKLETQVTSERLREELARANIADASIDAESPTSFRVEGVPGPQDGEFRRVADEQTGTLFNRQSGAGGAYRFEIGRFAWSARRYDYALPTPASTSWTFDGACCTPNVALPPRWTPFHPRDQIPPAISCHRPSRWVPPRSHP